MFRWYQEAARCYVYLSDVSMGSDNQQAMSCTWEDAFRASRWFTRGWTLQELLAPASVEFFSVEGELLGNKQTLEGLICSITSLPVAALQGMPLSTFTVDERVRWTEARKTKKPEDQAYCLLVIFGVFIPLIYGEGKNAYIRLRDEIKKRTDSTSATTHTHWAVTRTPNSLFTGREAVLHELGSVISDALANPLYQEQCRIVVSGMGGQGKSEICLQLAHRFRPRFWGVFWIDVSSTSLAERSFVDLARTLSLPAQTWEEACLGIANLRDSWLLVLDNADDPTLDYQPYIPTSPLGVVMVTSRNEECQQYATTTTTATVLEGLSAEAARDLLLKASRVPVHQHRDLEADAAQVAGLLQSHPLALIQAGAYVSRGYCRLGEYPDIYKRQRQRLLQFHPIQARSRYGDVYTTFEASADALKQSTATVAQDALEVLPLLAVCGPSRLPLAVFKEGWEGAPQMPPYILDDATDDEVTLLTPWHVSQLPALLNTSNEVWDPFQLMAAIQFLKAFALVSTESSGDSMRVSMHPLVHAWARDRQSADERHTHWLSIGCIMAFARIGGGLSPSLNRHLQAHVESVVGWDVGTMFAGAPRTLVMRVLVNCGWLLNQMRSDTKLALLIQALLDYLHLDERVVVQAWLGLFDLTSRNLYNCGKPQETISLLEQIGQLREPLAADHPSRLASQHTLAGAYNANGQVKEAVALLEDMVQIQEQLLAADHPSQLASQHELARAYNANEQVKEAVALLEDVIQIQKQLLEADHPSRLASQHALAHAYNANGQVKEAVALLEDVVQIQKQLLEADHPSRLASQHELARAYEANGQVTEAVALLEEVVRIRDQSLAADHPSRLASQHTLAGIYNANGQVKEAVALLENIVQIHKQLLAADHPNRLASQHELAGVYIANGQVTGAVALLEDVVQIQEQLLPDHPDRLASQHELAHAYKVNGQGTEAVALLEEAVHIKEQSLAASHPSRLVSEHNIAIYLWDLGQYQRARAMMNHVVNIRKQSLDEHHPDRLSSEGWLEQFEQDENN